MIALKITDIGTFINKLLKEGMCDHFLLQEAVITQAATFTIDGSLQADYFDSEETENLQLQDLSYVPFSLMRPHCLKLMQGKKKPHVSGMYLHFTYKNETLTCTTGISYRKFSLDKTLDQEWDRLVPVFLRKNGIAAEPV